MSQSSESRVDKFLWSVRIYKTRSISADACKKGKVIIDELQVKPSRQVKVNEVIIVKKPPVNYSYRIKGFPKNRVSAKLVSDYIEDITPEEELLKLDMADSFFFKRDRGSGRPTKKERRVIDKLKGK